MKYRSIISLLITGLMSSSQGLPGVVFPHAKVTVRVVDESGFPVPMANVMVSFSQGGNAWNGEYNACESEGLSDSNGIFSAQARCDGNVAISVVKEEYYESNTRQVYPGSYQNKTQWDPWNPTNTVVLKTVDNPIPMYAKKMRVKIPDTGTDIGFDLQKGDWVAPYGKGNVSDFIFRAVLEMRNERDYDYTLNLSFPNARDGIQTFEDSIVSEESRLKSDHDAPLDGYLSDWKQFRKRRPITGETNSFKANRKYYFRVRTITDEHGKIISANYGKIYGDFFTFSYYFNPTPNDRNLEFDPEKNLFKNLSPSEEVREP